MKKIIPFVLSALLLASCATQFTEEKTDMLHVGMNAQLAKELFGAPSSVSSSVCGASTSGGAWTCEKWTYETLSGESYLRFSVKPEGKFLNDWNVKR